MSFRADRGIFTIFAFSERGNLTILVWNSDKSGNSGDFLSLEALAESCAMDRRLPNWTIVAGIAFLTLFVGLGRPQLFDEDEPKNAECGREMFVRGDWLVPTFNEELRTDKPILVYWFMLTSYHLFGVTEFAARFWSAALGLGTCLLTYNIGRVLFSARVGLWAGIMLSSTLMFTAIARASTPDSTLIFFTTLSLFLFVRLGNLTDAANGWRELLPKRGLAFLAIFSAMAMAVLAKGPVGVLLPCVVVGCFLYVSAGLNRSQTEPEDSAVPSSRWTRFKQFLRRWFRPVDVLKIAWAMRPYWIVLCVAVIALPWYVAVGIETEGAWLQGFLGQHNVGRFLKPMEGHNGPVLYYPIAILIGFFPWSAFCLPVIRGLIHRLKKQTPEYQGLLFVVCWFAVYLTFFTCARTKLPNYILPCYPAIALMTAWWFERAGEAGVFRSVPREFTSAAWTLIGVGIVMAAGFGVAASIVLPSETILAGLGLVPLLGGLVIWWIQSQRGLDAARPVFAAVAVLFILLVFTWAAPRISRHQDGAYLAEELLEHQAPNSPVGAYNYLPPGLVFYAERKIQRCQAAEDIPALLSRDDSLLITRADRLEDLKPLLPPGTEVLARHKRFLRRHDVVILGRKQPGPAPVARGLKDSTRR